MPKSFRIQPNSRFDKKAVLWDAVNGGEPPVPPPPPYDGLCFTAEQAGSTLSLALTGGAAPVWTIETSTDGTNWNSYTLGTNITLTNVGDKVYFKGPVTNIAVVQSLTKYHQFTMSGKIAASGDIMSLMGNRPNLIADYQLVRLFYGCTSLTSAPQLTATTLTKYCYRAMFYGCSELLTAPELPATTMTQNCYEAMFYGCSNLLEAPNLPATTTAVECYYQMFKGCTSLEKAPESLLADNVATNAYNSMFEGCSSLIEAPIISFTSKSSQNALDYMFNQCSALSEIKLGWTGNFSSGFNYWVNGVAARGTFYYNGSSTTRGVSAIPTGWTITPF